LTLEEIAYKIYECRKCRLWKGAKHGVPGEGPPNAKVMMIGQNPGATEDELGRPFVGRTGRFLNAFLAENGLKREEFFITGAVKHVSPKNRKPFPDEVSACQPYVMAQIALINPKIILLLGEIAKSIPRLEGVDYIEAVHPSAAMRFPKMKVKFQQQINLLKEKIRLLDQSLNLK